VGYIYDLRKMLRNKLNISVLLPVFSLVLVMIWFVPGGIRGGAESGLPFYDLTRVAQLTSRAWTDVGLGTVVGAGAASNTTFYVLSKLQSTGTSPVVVQALVYFSLLLVSGISVFRLAKTFFPNIDDKFALLAALFYWFNPFSLVNAIGRNLDNYKFFFAALPLLWLIYILGLNKRKYVYALLFALVSCLVSYSFTFIPSLLLLWFTIFLTTVFYVFFSPQKGRTTFYIVYLITSLVGFFAVNYWWISQVFSFLTSAAFETSASNFFNDKGNLATLTALSKRLGFFVNNLRLMHGPYYYEAPNWNWTRIYTILPAVILEFTVSLIVLGTIFKFRRNRQILFLASVFTITLFLLKGNGEPFGELFQFVFERFIFLQVFRNPFEKIGFLLILVFGLLLSFGVWRLSLVRKRIAKYVFPVSFLVLTVFFGFPFWTGLVFTNTEGGVLKSNSIIVPEYYKEVSSWVDSQLGVFRFVSLPLGGEAITHNWEREYLGVELSSLLFNTPNVSFNSTIPRYNEIASSVSRYQIEPEILNFLPFINAKYIVWREDIDFKAREMPDPKIVRSKLDEWLDLGLLAKRFEAGKLAVYEINSDYFWPKIYLTGNKLITNSNDLASLSSLVENFPAQKFVTFDKDCLEKCTGFNKLVYVPEKVYLQKVSSPLPTELSDDDLLAKLFYSKHLPGDLIYPLIKLNERILEAREKDYDGWLLYKIGILGKRATEIYKLRKIGSDEDIIKKSEGSYMSTMRELEEDIVMLSQSVSPVSSVVKDSLIYQWVLLDRAGFKSQGDPLPLLLSRWNIKPTFELPVSENSYVIASFEVPVGGQYSILEPDRAEEVYFDGKRLNNIDQAISVDAGEHEIAILDDDEELYESVLESEELMVINNLEGFNFEFEFPDHSFEYDLDFDYRFIKGNLFQINIQQDIENKENSFYQHFKKADLDHNWVHYEASFTSLNGAKKANLIFESAKEDFCEKLWWGWRTCSVRDSEFSVEVKNLRLRKVTTPPILVVLDGTDGQNANKGEVSFEKINSAKYIAHIDKLDEQEEILVFSELYNSNWKATYVNGEQVPGEKHLLANVYANGWIVDKPGEYDIVIEFSSEKVLRTGKIVSVVSIVTEVLLITILVGFERKKNA